MGQAKNAQSGSLPVVAPEKYEEQLQEKLAATRVKFAPFGVPEPTVHRSVPKNYRNRAEFRVWHEDDTCYYIMFEKREGENDMGRVRMDSYPVATVLVNELMAAVMKEVHANEIFKKKLFQVNFHTTQSGDAMVTLLYHKALGEPWIEAAKGLRSALKAACPSMQCELPQVIGRSRKQKEILDNDHITEQFVVNGRTLQYRQVEGAFSQPNGGMCQQMLNWAHMVTASSPGDLVELYCGNGNFTLALADNFREVVGTEVSKVSVAAAKHNIEANSIKNVMVGAVSAEDFSKAWTDGVKLKRLDNKDLRAGYDFSTVLVDPPRAGLDTASVQMAASFDRIVYISCNPDTLAANLEEITKSHRVSDFAVFDQFPYTHHLECGVYLTRRTEKRKAEDEDAATEAADTVEA